MDKQSGFLMMAIALFLVVIAGLAAAFVAMMISGTNASISIISSNYAYDLAQTGIENGSYQLSLGTCSSSWSSIVTLGGQGEYKYSCSQYTASTTTTTALNATSTSIPLTSVANLANFGAITIDSEMIFYDGISGNILQNARRGENGTTAATHTLGAAASQSQYVISSQGGTPSLSAPHGQVFLYQAVLVAPNAVYYAVGTNGSNAVILRYDGSSWSTALTGQSGVPLSGIDMSSSYGQAVGHNATHSSYIYTFNGSTWGLGSGPLAGMDFQEVSCDNPLNPTTCWIVGQNGSPTRGLMYFNGSTYTASTNFLLSGVSCTGGVCKAVGSNHVYNFLTTSTNPFNTVTNLSTTLNDVDCPQASRCVTVRSNSSVYYFNGTSWSAAFALSGSSLNAVHCPSTSSCMVVGNSGRIFNCTLPITAASSCTQQSTPGSLNLADVHCNSTTDCLAVGTGTIAYRYTGGTWTTVSLPASYTLNAVSGISGSGFVVSPIVLRNQ